MLTKLLLGKRRAVGVLRSAIKRIDRNAMCSPDQDG